MLVDSLKDEINSYQDVALVIAWPDQTARGDEAWMAFFKRLGVVKNLNFKVGHAAIVLIQKQTGRCTYYDFGRYITPRGYGRARSALFDPRLQLDTHARFDENGQWLNTIELLHELDARSTATHGGGRLFFSVSPALNFVKASAFAQSLVDKGPILYGAVAPENNSCSRYVAQILLAGWDPKDPRRKDLSYPESFKPSPMSNVVNGTKDRMVYCWHEGNLTNQYMNRWGSLRFQIDLLTINLYTKKAANLPSDLTNGHIDTPARPSGIPLDASWLGGLGEGAWFALTPEDSVLQHYRMYRFDTEGNEDYQQVFRVVEGQFNTDLPWEWTYDIGFQQFRIQQGTESILLVAEEPPIYESNSQIKTTLQSITQWN